MSTQQSRLESGSAVSVPLVRFVSRAVQPPRDTPSVGPARRRVLSLDEEFMSNSETTSAGGTAVVRDIPIDWEALEDAFENNAPEVHSYLHMVTGDVLRVVDGVADPQMHARIAADPNYLRIDPVSSREQYRWMERYIPMV